MDIYEQCPTMQDDRYLARPLKPGDAFDLFPVYSDVAALPFFNSDNCDGDNFHYATITRMQEAVDFWIGAYLKGWFVRWSIVDKATGALIGTIEMCRRRADDAFDDVVLRVDVSSKYERAGHLASLLRVALQGAPYFGAPRVILKVPVYAIERAKAATAVGFKPSDGLLVGKDGYAYKDYWELRASNR
ncbi:MAG: GNAT family protein [Bifidobacterium sp.]|nr:GNAT family protein [Bifidobacterium sp.]